MSEVRLSDLTSVHERAKEVRRLLPSTGNPDAIRETLRKMGNYDLGMLFRAIDELVFAGTNLGHLTVGLKD